MTKTRFALLLFMVIVLAGATIGMAYLAVGEGMQLWMAAMGPVLLMLTLFFHLRGQRK